MNNQEKFDFLSKLPFFINIEKSILVNLLEYIDIQLFRKSKYLYYQEDKATFAYYQINGLIKEEKIFSTNTMVIGNFTFDKWYGLEEVLLSVNYFHDVTTLNDSMLLSISKYNLDKAIKISEIKDLIYNQILKNYQIIENKLNMDSPDIKIINYLLSFADGEGEYEIIITQDQLSKLLNFTRETINKHLKKLENIDVINLNRGIIKIINKERLKKLLE